MPKRSQVQMRLASVIIGFALTFAAPAFAQNVPDPRIAGIVQAVTDEYFVVKSDDGKLTIVYLDQGSLIVADGKLKPDEIKPGDLKRGLAVSLTYNRTMGPRFTGRLITVEKKAIAD